MDQVTFKLASNSVMKFKTLSHLKMMTLFIIQILKMMTLQTFKIKLINY